MCTGAEYALLLASAAGTSASVASQQAAMRKQDRTAARGIIEQAAIQRQAGERVNQQIQELNASNPDAERAAATQDFVTALQRARLTQGGEGLETPGGAVSDRFKTGADEARAAAGGENVRLAGQLARIDAPAYQRVKEGQRMAAAGSDLGLLSGTSAAQDYLMKLKLAGIAPNPWVDAAGQGLSAWAQAYAGRAQPSATGSVPTGGVSGTIRRPAQLPSWLG